MESATMLDACLAELHGLLRQLLEAAQEKLDALRRADPERLQDCAAEETEVLKRVFEAEQRRGAVLARLAQGLQLPDARSAGLTALADRLPEPCASQLRARIAGLREIAATLQRKNRVAACVARDLQIHLQGVFLEVAKVNSETVVYGPQGQHKATPVRCWVDAVG